MSDIEKKQLPFATSQALTRTAWRCKNILDDMIPKKIDRPTPFTLRAVGVKRATKKNLQSEVFIRDKQEDYLRYAIEGGDRTAETGKQIYVKTKKSRLNKYGNMTRGRVKRFLKNKKKYFEGRIKGSSSSQFGLWQRMGKKGRGNIRLVVEYRKTLTYKKRLPFYASVRDTVNREFSDIFRRELAKAVQSARR